MAHHQGMSLLSLAYLLLDRPMQRRFESRPRFSGDRFALAGARPQSGVRSIRIPRKFLTRSDSSVESGGELPRLHYAADRRARGASAFQRPLPRCGHRRGRRLQPLARPGRHALAGGFHARLLGHVLLSPRRRKRRVLVDSAATDAQTAAILRGDLFAGPRRVPPPRRRTSKLITEISVSPEDDIELRRISITNRGRIPRTIELTSYAEVVLAPPAADAAHPAFSNLFVQTELVRDRQAILCTRRPRSAGEKPPWMLHLMTVHGDAAARHRTRPTARIHRPGPNAGGPGGDAPHCADRQRRIGARSDRGHSQHGGCRAGRDRAGGPGDRRRRDTRGRDWR